MDALFSVTTSALARVLTNWPSCSLMPCNPSVNIFVVSSHIKAFSITSKDNWIS
ncbi:hypothetical protein LguiA_025166 [Lonicera macranthoides]